MNKLNILVVFSALGLTACVTKTVEKHCFDANRTEILCVGADNIDDDVAPYDDETDAGTSEQDAGDVVVDTDDADAGQDDQADASVTPPPPPPADYTHAPFYSVQYGELRIASEYLNSACSELRGSLPNTSWSDGPRLDVLHATGSTTVNNVITVVGYYSYDINAVPNGTYDVTAEVVNCSNGVGTGKWSDFGTTSAKLKSIGIAGRAYVQCPTASCQNPGGACKGVVVISTSTSGTRLIAGGGNMATATDCN